MFLVHFQETGLHTLPEQRWPGIVPSSSVICLTAYTAPCEPIGAILILVEVVSHNSALFVPLLLSRVVAAGNGPCVGLGARIVHTTDPLMIKKCIFAHARSLGIYSMW